MILVRSFPVPKSVQCYLVESWVAELHRKSSSLLLVVSPELLNVACCEDSGDFLWKHVDCGACPWTDLELAWVAALLRRKSDYASFEINVGPLESPRLSNSGPSLLQ